MDSITGRFRSVVVLNGTMPTSSSLEPFLEKGATLIAADGAAWGLNLVSLCPDIIIGDLDSLRSRPNSELSFAKSEILEVSDQESNDFEKALRLVLHRDLAPVLVAGMQGGDLEHSFNNWSVLIKLCQEMELWVLEQERIGLVLKSSGQVRGYCKIDKTVSLIPQPECVVTTTGLRWPLKEEKLALGLREGARNEATDGEFSVRVHSGSLLVFFGMDTHVLELTF